MVTLIHRGNGALPMFGGDDFHSEGASCSKGEQEEEEDKGVTFEPRLYMQRYMAVQQVLREYDRLGMLKKVVDLGCAECKLLNRLRYSLRNVESLIGVDIEKELLTSSTHWLREVRDREYFLDRRHCPLNIQLLKGDMTQYDERLEHTDAVVCIEVIEHLEADILRRVPTAVFEVLHPRIAMFTTPNSEFNVMFEFEPGKQFRHDDHKFEWTRRQFTDWCLSITNTYPQYRVHISGIGLPYHAHSTTRKSSASASSVATDLGYCSQMAVFVRTDALTTKPIRSGVELELGLCEMPLLPKRPFRAVLDHTYPYDEHHNREQRVRLLAVKYCDQLINKQQPNASALEKVEEAYLISARSIYNGLPDDLKELIGSCDDMTYSLCSDSERLFRLYAPPNKRGFAAYAQNLEQNDVIEKGYKNDVTSNDAADCDDAKSAATDIRVIYPAYDAPEFLGFNTRTSSQENVNQGVDDYEVEGNGETWYVGGDVLQGGDGMMENGDQSGYD